MEKERINRIIPNIAPPKWWHDVLRTKFVGYQEDKDTFSTLNTEFETGIRYAFHSFLQDGVKTADYTEGIFIQLAIPNYRKSESGEIALKVAVILGNELRSELEKNASSEEEAQEMETNTEFAGCLTKIDRKVAMKAITHKIDVPEMNINTPGYTNYLVTLVPADDEFIKNFIANDIRDKFFLKMSFLNRIRFIGNTSNRDLKVAILKEQYHINSEAIKEMVETKVVDKNELEMVGDDPEVQALLENLTRNLVNANTHQEMVDLTESYKLLEPLIKTAFLEFTTKFWAKKFGVQLPDNTA